MLGSREHPVAVKRTYAVGNLPQEPATCLHSLCDAGPERMMVMHSHAPVAE